MTPCAQHRTGACSDERVFVDVVRERARGLGELLAGRQSVAVVGACNPDICSVLGEKDRREDTAPPQGPGTRESVAATARSDGDADVRQRAELQGRDACPWDKPALGGTTPGAPAAFAASLSFQSTPNQMPPLPPLTVHVEREVPRGDHGRKSVTSALARQRLQSVDASRNLQICANFSSKWTSGLRRLRSTPRSRTCLPLTILILIVLVDPKNGTSVRLTYTDATSSHEIVRPGRSARFTTIPRLPIRVHPSLADQANAISTTKTMAYAATANEPKDRPINNPRRHNTPSAIAII
ncbi:hypothetical protein ABIA32_004531 [Streptacidiphilus sp. MAP12-20]